MRAQWLKLPMAGLASCGQHGRMHDMDALQSQDLKGHTVVESCKRQGRDALAYLRQAMHGYFAGSAAPSLVPSG